MARAGSKAYWVAYYDEMYGEYLVSKLRDSDEERDLGRIIARSYQKAVVSKAARNANERSERNPSKRKRKRRSNASKRSVRKRVSAALKKYVRGNPSVKGRKVKGGRSVTLKNFTGTIVKKSDGTVDILGRGRR